MPAYGKRKQHSKGINTYTLEGQSVFHIRPPLPWTKATAAKASLVVFPVTYKCTRMDRYPVVLPRNRSQMQCSKGCFSTPHCFHFIAALCLRSSKDRT